MSNVSPFPLRCVWLEHMKNFSRLLGFAACVSAMALRASGGEFVTVSATAAKDYARPAGPDGLPRPETYVVSKGVFFDGSTKDSGLEKTPFIDVAATVGKSLLRQNYFPAKDPQLANLLIVVHWGTTTVYEDPLKDFRADDLQRALSSYNAAVGAAASGGGMPDSSELNSALSARDNETASASAFRAYNAKLLGYETALQKRRVDLFAGTDEVTFENDLAVERYFVVLMAYDYQALKKDHQRKLLWTTRMSVQSAGTNFKTALPDMSQMAANAFGKQLDDLMRAQTNPKEGRVDIGEAKVVADPDPVAAKKKK
jgi:hypothetical protein